jgi:hypothetical protein
MKYSSLFIIFILLCLSCVKTSDNDSTPKTHTVAFRLTSSTNATVTGVGISYDITDGTRVRGLFVSCNNMPWQSSNYTNLAAGTGVGISILVNNGPSYGGNGNLTIQILVDQAVWKSSTITMTTAAQASLGGTL